MKQHFAPRFVNWCRYDMLPLWAELGWDSDKGGFFEDLHLNGQPDREVRRRVRVTSRQIYVYAHASRLKWYDGLDLVNRGVQWLLDKGREAGKQGFVHQVNDDGVIKDTKRDLYDHAFHILAFSQAAMATGDAQILQLAKDTFDFVETHLGSKTDDGWMEDLDGSLPRRQNPHMHMFEALLSLHEATNDPAFLNRAGQILDLMQSHWIDAGTGTLLEFFDQGWTPAKPITVEPGHMMEWCWLAHTHDRLGGKATNPTLPWQDLAAKLGQSPAAFLLDAIHPLGEPLSDTSRLWSQTEWLKALCVAHERASDDIANKTAVALTDRLFQHYLVLEPSGLWIDKVDAKGKALSKRVPQSIVYHLMSAAAEVQRVFMESETEG